MAYRLSILRHLCPTMEVTAITSSPPNSTNSINDIVEENRGTLIGCWMAFGSYDLVVIAEIQSDQAMASVVLGVNAVGTTAGGKTTKLLTMEKAVKAMTGVQSEVNNYNPPSNWSPCIKIKYREDYIVA